METKKPSLGRTLLVFLIAVIIFIVLAYGIEVTNVKLDTLREPQRQAQLTRVIRALFHPDIVEYEQKEVTVNSPIYVPCPTTPGPEVAPSNPDEAYLVITPACASPEQTVHVEGFGFANRVQGSICFVPATEPPVTLNCDGITTDADGHFSAEYELPNRPNENVQTIRAVLRQKTGAPHFSRNAIDTWDLIIQTIFLALLATIVGTILAVPLSFLAARNLMKSVRSPLASIALSILGWIVGIYLGFKLSSWISQFSQPYVSNLPISALGAVVIPVILIFIFRWALPEEESRQPQTSLHILRTTALLAMALLAILGMLAFAGLMMGIGTWLGPKLGTFSFLGSSLFHLGDILRTIIPLFFALATGGALGNLAGRYGQQATERLPARLVKALNIVVAVLAGAVILGLLGAVIEWLYKIGRPEITLWGAALFGALLGTLIALRIKAKDTLAIGLLIYYVLRTILNALRAIEPLIYCIVFVIAFSLGPFPGVLALGLHTIVSNAKLYSEQVESISPGPLEAIEATGANRLQTIIFAVVPQVIPPYISYTMYRWDINVRMSTIIGFVGGGGIGFLLYQNIQLLRYQQAATQILAIAVVVATLDYVSSIIRERFV